MTSGQTTDKSLKSDVFTVIFGHHTTAGRWFDILLILAIVISVICILLDSVTEINALYGKRLLQIEWGFTALFTLEYLVRLWCSPNRTRYAFSFYGIVDLLSIIPTYLSLFLIDIHYLLALRLIRVLRVFRVLKLFSYIEDSQSIAQALWASHRKILIFLYFVIVVTTVFGSLMFIIEGPEHGFTSIPKSIYWAIVTITTVGYGDIAPQTVPGQTIATLAMIIGYAIIAVPTSIVTVEMSRIGRKSESSSIIHLPCSNCETDNHYRKANYCYNCGTELPQ